jgi:hypothetical protein
MRNYLPIVAFVGLTLATGPAFAEASGSAGDMTAPSTQPSSSDVNNGTANQNAAPNGGGNAPTMQQNAPMADQGTQGAPMVQHKRPTHHAAAHHKTGTKRVAAHHARHARMASRGNGPCFPLAMQFDRRLSGMLSGNAQDPKIQQATDMRNKAMEACNAGHTKEGEQQLRQAIAGL